MNTDAVFREANGYLIVGNSLPMSNLEVLQWEYSFEIATGKEKSKTSKPHSEIPREDFVRYHDQKTKTLEEAKKKFVPYFIDKLDKVRKSEYLKKSKLNISSLIARKFNDYIVIQMKNSFESNKSTGVVFLNDITGDVTSFGLETARVHLKGSKEFNKTYFTLGLKDGLNCFDISKQNTIISFSKDELVNVVKRFSHKNTEAVCIVVGKNPRPDELSEDFQPLDYIRDFRDLFSNHLNVYIITPPVTPITDGEKAIETLHDYFLKNPYICMKIINSEKSFPNIKILGSLGGNLYVWSKHLSKPMILSQSSKYPSLLLIADDSYYKEKFGTTNEKVLIKKLFNIGRGMIFDNTKIRMAGVWKEDKKIIINTGSKIIGEPEPKNNFFYLKKRIFPEPTPDPIDAHQFSIIREKLLNNLGTKDPLEGYTVFAWSILSLFAHVLPLRFSLHLYGDSSAGKSFTRDNLMVPLQSKFKSNIKKYIPGQTFAGLKDDLRDGCSVIYFDEDQGKNYDERILQIIKGATYEESFIKQMTAYGQGSINTPISFMSCSLFNFQKEMQEADRNRIYSINYSIRSLNDKRKAEALSAIALLDLDKMGLDTFSYLYYHWRDFLSNYEKSKREPSCFGTILNGHKRGLLSLILSFYRTTGLMDNKTLDEYTLFLRKRGEEDQSSNFNKDFMHCLMRVAIADEGLFKKKTLKSLIDSPVYLGQSQLNLLKEQNREEEPLTLRYVRWKKWIDHLSTHYNIRVIQSKKNGGLWLTIPIHDYYIPLQLTKDGMPRDEASSYATIIESEYNFVSIVNFGKAKRKSVCIPLDHCCSELSVLVWQNISSKGLGNFYNKK